MPGAPQSSLEVGSTREDASLTVILLHGLGADGYDFEDVAGMLCQAAQPRKWRFVLPHAPVQAVTINAGMEMPAWYDILDLDHPRQVNWATVEASRIQIEGILAEETAPKIVVAGFSQGGAMALDVGLRHQQEIAGIMALSGYLLESDEHPVPPKNADFPIGLFHGCDDPVVPISAAEQSECSLSGAGYSPSLHRYDGLGHSVGQEEIADVFAWFRSLDELSPPRS